MFNPQVGQVSTLFGSACREYDLCANVTGHTDRCQAEASSRRVDEHHLTGTEPSKIDECMPSGLMTLGSAAAVWLSIVAGTSWV